MFLKQSTAYTFRFGPFLDDTDGKTVEPSFTIEDSHIRVSKDGANFIDKAETSNSAYDEFGFYVVVLNATDTNTVGELLIACHFSGALPVFKTFFVVEEAIYDAIYAPSATLAASVASILEDTATTIPATIATVDTVVDAVKVVTDAISTNGSGLSAVPWNASWDAEVQSEVADALVAIGLDHLVSASVAGSDVVDNSIVAKLVSKESTADWDDFVNTTDSLQALRDRGDASWVTGGGGSASAIADAVWDEATSGHTTSGTFGEQVKTDIDAILLDTAEIGAAGAGLTALWTTDIAEAYAGPTETACTPAQLLYMIFSCVGSFTISSDKVITYDLPGSGSMAQAMRFDMDSTTNPTYRKRDA